MLTATFLDPGRVAPPRHSCGEDDAAAALNEGDGPGDVSNFEAR